MMVSLDWSWCLKVLRVSYYIVNHFIDFWMTPRCRASGNNQNIETDSCLLVGSSDEASNNQKHTTSLPQLDEGSKSKGDIMQWMWDTKTQYVKGILWVIIQQNFRLALKAMSTIVPSNDNKVLLIIHRLSRIELFVQWMIKLGWLINWKSKPYL